MNIIQLFAALGGAPPAVQYLRPDGNRHEPAASWSPQGDSELWLCTDDVVPDEDATYARSDNTAVNWWFSTLSNPVAPPRASQLHKLVVRARYLGTVIVGPPRLNWQIQGTSGGFIVIPDVELTESWADYEYTLTEADIAKITDYDALSLAIEILAYLPGNTGYEGRITQMYLQIGGE